MTNLDNLRAARQQDADKLNDFGNEAYKKEQYVLAAQHYSDAIKLCKDNKAYYISRAACYNKLHRYDAAIKDASTAIAIFKFLEDSKLPLLAANASTTQRNGLPLPVKAYMCRAESLQALMQPVGALRDYMAGETLCTQSKIPPPPELVQLKETLLQGNLARSTSTMARLADTAAELSKNTKMHKAERLSKITCKNTAGRGSNAAADSSAGSHNSSSAEEDDIVRCNLDTVRRARRIYGTDNNNKSNSSTNCVHGSNTRDINDIDFNDGEDTATLGDTRARTEKVTFKSK